MLVTKDRAAALLDVRTTTLDDAVDVEFAPPPIRIRPGSRPLWRIDDLGRWVAPCCESWSKLSIARISK